MRLNSFPKARVIPAVCCLIIALLFVAAPAMAAATEEVTVTKYCDNNYTAAADSETLDLAELQALSSVYSNGPVYMQGGTFDYGLDSWAYTESSMSNFGVHNGTYVRNITDQVGGMNAGDEIWVVASDGYKTYFNHTNVYAPDVSQGEMILSWQNDTSTVPTYEDGIRLFFYTPPGTYGMSDSLNFTNEDMRDSMASWYWRLVRDKFAPNGIFPSAKGLSSKTVSDLAIYPPHRYDFNTTGDTTEWAYEGGVGASPGLNDPSGTTVDTSKIADDDGIYEPTVSSSDGEYAAQRFVFDVVEDPDNIEKLAVTWDGTSSHDDGSVDQGATVYIWKSGTGYEPISGDITSNIGDYIVDGNVTVLVKQNVAQFYDDDDEEYKFSRLATDYVKLVVTHHHRNSGFTL